MKRKFKVLAISATTAVVLGGLVITAGAVMNSYANVVDGYLGAGDLVITKREGSENWEGNYYDFKCKTAEESYQNASEVSQKVAGEGIVLLKNQDNLLPLAANSKITLMGVNSGHHVTGPTDDVQGKNGITIGEALKEAGFNLNDAVWNFYKSKNQNNVGSGEISPTNADYQSTVVPAYEGYTDGTAMIVLRRSWGEGSDPSTDMGDAENHRNALSPSANELDLIQEACDHFANVVIVITSPNTMELGFLKDGNYTDPHTLQTYDFTKVKGAFWIGGIGLTGSKSFAKIIKGEINPSGRLVDTYVRDNLNDIPANVNYGQFQYTNFTSAEGEFYCKNNYTVEYEEGIYVGYRYFETAAFEAAAGNFEGFNYDHTVIYPFGYGLSYTTFSQEFKGAPSYDEKSETYTFQVEVKNTGSVAGKVPVQIYCSAPYTKGGIEKAHVVLAGFAKTGLIAAGASETVKVEVQKDYIASYDYKNEKCYVLDEGDYKFLLSENAHSWASIGDSDAKLCQKVHINKTVYKGDKKRVSDKVAAENLFDRDLNWRFKEYTENQPGSGYLTNLTRANFKASWPTAPTGKDLEVNDYLLEAHKVYDPSKDYSNTVSPYKDVEQAPGKQEVSVDRGVLQLADMRGIPFDDPSWDKFIDQLTLDELNECFTVGGWGDNPITDLGAPKLTGGDSPSGITSFMIAGLNTFYPYFAEVTLTATWNVELAREYGDAMAEEAQAQRELTGGQSFNYLFGPGANTHRTPFGGRNHEYYSEDSLLAGKMLAAEASGAGEKGLIMLPKHCALNEQETVRQGGQSDGHEATYTSFVNEQGLREIYMRVWEIYAKEAKRMVKRYNDAGEFEEVEMTAASALMTSYNRIGGVWSGASPIIEGLLRKECGFTGTSFTDAGGEATSYMNTDWGLVTGGTTACLKNGAGTKFNDSTSDTHIYHAKKAAHIKLFNVANSNAMIGITPGSKISYTMSPWQKGLIAAYIATGVVVLGLAGLTVYMFISPKGNFEKAKVAKSDDDE